MLILKNKRKHVVQLKSIEKEIDSLGSVELSNEDYKKVVQEDAYILRAINEGFISVTNQTRRKRQ